MFDTNLAKHIAELSKLEFSQDELETLICEMDDIIKLMEKVTDFNKENATQLSNAVPYSQLRIDEVKQSSEVSEIISNAKLKENNCFSVPKII